MAFACPVAGGKRVALCWETAAFEGVLRYRYGTPTTVELSYPNADVAHEDAFEFFHELWPSPPGGEVRPRLEHTKVRFAVESVRYELYEDEVDFERTQGVKVTLADGKEVDIPCARAAPVSLQEVGW